MDFIGQEDLDPNLDIQVELRIARVNILIQITGPASEMILSLDSEPSMEKSDILSYLVYGKPAKELNNQQFFNAEQAALNRPATGGK